MLSTLLEERTTALTSEVENRRRVEEELRPEGAVESARRAVAPARKPRTVLVVEDCIDLALFTVAMLHDQGYGARRAANALEALAMLERGESFDAVFSDIVMPGPINGIQLARTLHESYPHLAIVLATGNRQRMDGSEPPIGAEVLSKPYGWHKLTAALERAFAVATAPEAGQHAGH